MATSSCCSARPGCARRVDGMARFLGRGRSLLRLHGRALPRVVRRAAARRPSVSWARALLRSARRVDARAARACRRATASRPRVTRSLVRAALDLRARGGAAAAREKAPASSRFVVPRRWPQAVPASLVQLLGCSRGCSPSSRRRLTPHKASMRRARARARSAASPAKIRALGAAPHAPARDAPFEKGHAPVAAWPRPRAQGGALAAAAAGSPAKDGYGGEGEGPRGKAAEGKARRCDAAAAALLTREGRQGRQGSLRRQGRRTPTSRTPRRRGRTPRRRRRARKEKDGKRASPEKEKAARGARRARPGARDRGLEGEPRAAAAAAGGAQARARMSALALRDAADGARGAKGSASAHASGEPRAHAGSGRRTDGLRIPIGSSLTSGPPWVRDGRGGRRGHGGAARLSRWSASSSAVLLMALVRCAGARRRGRDQGLDERVELLVAAARGRNGRRACASSLRLAEIARDARGPGREVLEDRRDACVAARGSTRRPLRRGGSPAQRRSGVFGAEHRAARGLDERPREIAARARAGGRCRRTSGSTARQRSARRARRRSRRRTEAERCRRAAGNVLAGSAARQALSACEQPLPDCAARARSALSSRGGARRAASGRRARAG